MTNLKKNILNNGIASFLEKGVRVLEQLFLVPFFITAWGAAYYGEWLTLTIIPSVLVFSDLGFGTAAANSFVISYSAGNKQQAANISRTGMYIISIMVAIGMTLSILAIFILNYYNIFEKSLINAQDAIISITILILACLISFYNQLIESYYRSARKAALSINLLTIKSGLKLGSGLLVLLAGYGVVAFASSQLLVVIVFNLYYWQRGKKVLGLFDQYNGQIERPILKDIANKGLGYLMSPVWQTVYFQGTTFVVRVVLGPEAVAIFNTVRTLSRSINQLFSMINSSVFPELQFELGAGREEKAKKLFRISVLSVFLAAIIGAIFLAFFGLWFYKIWTNNELTVPHLMWYIFVVGILFNAIWSTASMIFRAVNKPYSLAIIGILSAIISVGLSYLFSLYWGLNGVAMGSIVLDILMAILILPIACKLLNMQVLDIFSHGFSDIQEIYSKIKVKLNIT